MAVAVRRVSLMRKGFNRGPISRLTDIIGLGDATDAPLDINVEVELQSFGGSPPAAVEVLLERFEPGSRRRGRTRFTRPSGLLARRVGSTSVYRARKPFGELWAWAPDSLPEVATVVRHGGTSDRYFRKPLRDRGWAYRGTSRQPKRADDASGSIGRERPDALRHFYSGGVEVLEVRVKAQTGLNTRNKKTWGFLRSPADIFYYSGHGQDGQLKTHGHLDPWLTPQTLLEYWRKQYSGKPHKLRDVKKEPFDLKLLVIAGCSVLDCEVTPTGVEWAELVSNRKGPLDVILGYGGRADLDRAKYGGNRIGGDLGKAIAAGVRYDALARKWLEIHQQNPRNNAKNAVAIDKRGYWKLNTLNEIVGPTEMGLYRAMRRARPAR